MSAQAKDLDVALTDLGPLAWVLDELRKSLDTASKALKRFVRDADAARGSDLSTIDDSQLRVARQQLHQAVGALEMVGLGTPGTVLRAMEVVVQKFIQHPDLCNESAAQKVERAGFALTEFLQAVLAGKTTSAVALFPQYRDMQELAGSERCHPADLWAKELRWIDAPMPANVPPLAYEVAVRSQLDQWVLKVIKGANPEAAKHLVTLSLGLSLAQVASQPRIFWKICAGFFEALALGLCPSDLYAKRTASRVLMQYAALSKGEMGVPERLVLDLLFYCAHAQPVAAVDAPHLSAIRHAYGLAHTQRLDYMQAQFGRIDPALVVQARKRINAAKESWTALSGGDASKLKQVVDQFSAISESLLKLSPQSSHFAQSLMGAIEAVARTGLAPAAELAMEVATSVLYLDAAFEEFDPADDEMAYRTTVLADRLDLVLAGGQAQPLESWMEELYRRVSDKQTMGSVVSELRGSLGELEAALDQFFRNPADKSMLTKVPAQLSQMRGVLSVLGLEQGSLAVLHMRGRIEQLIVTEIDVERARQTGTFEKLGNNLGSLGLLIDMLNYQPVLAKKLFVYDEALSELKPVMGRSEPKAEPIDIFEQESSPVIAVPTPPPLAAVTAPAPAAQASTPAPASQDSGDEEDEELRDIFLEEAREVVQTGGQALQALDMNPKDVGEQTTLRRAFHTLKGSSRMVGLNEFGEAAWSLEQLLNTWLAEQKPFSEELRVLCQAALNAFGQWVEDIHQRTDAHWQAQAFRLVADAARVDHKFIALVLPTAAASAEPVAEETVSAVALPDAVVSPAALLSTEAVPAQADFDLDALPEFDVVEVTASVPSDVQLEDFSALTEAMNAPTEPPLASLAEPLAQELFEVAPATTAFEAAESPEISFELDQPAAVSAALPTELLDFSAADELAAPTPPAGLLQASEAEFDAQELADFALPDALAASTESLAASTESAEMLAASDFELPLASVELPDTPGAQDFAIAGPASASPAAAFVSVPAPSAAVSPVLAEPVPSPEAPPAEKTVTDERTKVIGSLSISIALYNVYLNEADEWSRRLVTETSEWALELDHPVKASMISLAHSLAGTSATVGFASLSELARALEHAMQHVAKLRLPGTPELGLLFTQAAQDIRRLLHQFAAGFLKTADADVLRQLHLAAELQPQDAELASLEVAQPQELSADELLDADFFNPVPAASAPTTLPVIDSQPERIAALAEIQLEIPAQAGEDVPAEATEELVQAVLAVPAELPLQSPTLPSLNLPAAPIVQAPIAVQVARPSTAINLDDEFDAVDAIDPDLFPIFQEEGHELFPQLGSSLRQWAARPSDSSAKNEVLRVLHTLKGSARLSGAMRLGEMAHRMESDIEHFGTASAADIEPLLGALDALQTNFDNLRVADEPAPVMVATPALALPPVAAAAPPVAAFAAVVAAPASAVLPTRKTAVPAATAEQITTAAAQSLPPEISSLAKPAANVLTVVRQAANQAVRVRSQLLDRLVNQAGEVIITRSRIEGELRQLRGSLADMTDNLDRLRQQLRDIELQSESQMQSRMALAKESDVTFDPLEFDRFTRVQELTRMMAESVNDVATVQRTLQRTMQATEDDLIAQARQTRELQRDLLRTRMVEFEGISERLYRVVRQASKDAGKQVKLDITGGSIEMDRGVLDRMTPAFEHLLRNCVAHGVELPQVRTAAGKESSGTITVDLHQSGNDVSVEFRDDGAGLNLPRIRTIAQERGLLAAGQNVSDQEAANLIFMPGFSTATEVTELSGRGVGMDVVRAEVNALGGRVETTTKAGQGTSFKLVLPLTTAVTQVVMFRAGDTSIGVPASVVELVRRVTPAELEEAYKTGHINFGGEQVPFFWCGALLQVSARSIEKVGRSIPVMIYKSAQQRVAMHVDEVLGNQEVVVKNLGPQLARLPGLSGMSVLASGAVVLIYNPVALATVYGAQARDMLASSHELDTLRQITQAEMATQQIQQVPLVLVVDDSITVRRVTQRLLQREGYRVAMAADGLLGLEQLAQEIPAVVLSDIEMPRMDGFDFARNIRADARMKHLPIVMITSRIAEKHREHAMELGVNHYLGKPYSEDELLGLVKRYCYPEQIAAEQQQLAAQPA